ncbi:MAG: PKD domain-containing protein [Novosphingobium sp.]|nr:PKD domain-containing protein [Novosphingobium sp.]MCP5403081.1 PKD domain-containing protein [Novosphingobium sp.]
MTTAASDRPVTVTGDSVDPLFSEPYVEVNELRQEPVPHRYVHGGFKGTEARFSFYFPPEDQYQGRFFHNTYPMAVTSDIGPFPIEFEVAMGDLGFTIDSGAYYVQTNNGGVFRDPSVDPAVPAYRVNAAAAKYSRMVAAEVYGEHRPYGYLFGGSGGAYQTLGAAENTSGVWDGFVPFVPGCDQAIPSMFTVRMHALRVLRQRENCLPGIADALDVGGSGDPYAGLDEEEAAAFREVSLMGFPLRGWYDYAAMNSGYFANISGMIPAMDPSYVEDFWSKPGYLGTDPGSKIGDERFKHDSAVAGVKGGPPFLIELVDGPGRDCADAHLLVLSGDAAGNSLPIKQVTGNTVELIMTADPVAAAAIGPGDSVRIDNDWTLALQTYHRHQVPADPKYYGWNQFRGEDGTPVYPQRGVLVGTAGTVNSAGSMLEGRHDGKMLMLAVLLDIDSFPWQADWYKSQVKAAKGSDFGDNYALYFVDNAHHENPMRPIQRAHAISYSGALQQALRDVAAWVEKGVHPSDTVYDVADTQVVVSAKAAERKGIQPVIDLKANGGARAEVTVGEPVKFTATIEAPPGSGQVVSAQWDFEGAGEFSENEEVASPGARVNMTAEHAYSQPGTHFAVLRVASQREGDMQTPYARVQNIARVRVVVS